MTRPRPSRLPRRPPGVSLLELMLVLALLGILLAMGGARFMKMQTSNVFTNEVDRFGGELKMLGAAARTSGDLQPATLAAAINNTDLDVCKVGADGTLGSPLMQVLFKPDGSPVDPGDIQIGITGRTYVTHLSPMGAIDGPRLP